MKRAAGLLLSLFLLFPDTEANAQAPTGAAASGSKALQALFHLDFEGNFSATATGAGAPLTAGKQPEKVNGVKGKAAMFRPGQVLRYNAKGNLHKPEGTIAFWLRMPAAGDAKTGEQLTLFSEDGPETKGCNSLRIELHYGRFIRFSLKDGRDSYVYYHKIADWNEQEWHHLAFTWNALKGAGIYVDGKHASIGWMPQWTPAVHTTFFIGAANAKGEQACNATLDEFQIYNREFTEADARSAYLQFRNFVAEASVTDPFLTAAKAGVVPVVFRNPGDKEINLQNLRFELAGAGGKVVQQGKLQEQKIPGTGKITVPVKLSAASPGPHTLTLFYSEKEQTKQVKAAVQVVAAAPKAKEQQAQHTLIAEINAVTQQPVGEFGGTFVVTTAAGAYREGGQKMRDRFALDFKVTDVNEPHLAVITYPDDKPRSMEVMLQDFGNTIDFQVHTGVFTGEEYPLSNRMQEHSAVFWPRSEKQAFIFMTAEPGYPAAVQNIKIYRLKDFAVTPAKGTFAGSVPARSTGLYYEDPVLFHNFGTARDGEGFTKATDRMLQYMQSFGQSEVEYPLAWYAGPLYGSHVEPFQPDIDGAQGGQRPHPEGYPKYLLQRLHEQNMKFTAGLHIHTLPSLNKYALADTTRIHAGEETAININKDGKLWYGYWHGADPNYNPADPRVMQSVNAIVNEVCERYAQEPAFDGISLVMARPKLFTFGSLASGYNDTNLKRFQEHSGIKIPVYKAGDPERFAKSYNWLMSNPAAKKAWIDWRCQVLYDHYAAIAKQMAAHRPDLKLKLNVFVHLTNNHRLADYLNEQPVEVMREMGIDPALYKNHPNIVLNHTLVPADLRWTRNNDFPGGNPEISRTIMTAPEVAASLQEHENVRVTIHDRYWEDAIGREQPLKGLKALGVNEMVWRASTFNGVAYHSMEPYMFALHHLDATSIVKGGYVVGTFGMELYLNRFSQALSALPAVKFDDVQGVADPVRIRQKVVDGKLYFYVLNTLPEPLSIKVKLQEKGSLSEPATGAATGKSRSVSLKLEPYELRVFTSASATQRVTDGDATVPKPWLSHLQRNYEQVLQSAKAENQDNGKYAPYLKLARQTWQNKHYSRLYFLLQEDWVKEILGKNPGAASSLNR